MFLNLLEIQPPNSLSFLWKSHLLPFPVGTEALICPVLLCVGLDYAQLLGTSVDK